MGRRKHPTPSTVLLPEDLPEDGPPENPPEDPPDQPPWPLPAVPGISEDDWPASRAQSVASVRALAPRAVSTLDRLMRKADKDEVSAKIALSVLAFPSIQIAENPKVTANQPQVGLSAEVAGAIAASLMGFGHMLGSKQSMEALSETALRVVKETGKAKGAPKKAKKQALIRPADGSSGLSPDLEAACLSERDENV